MSTIERLYYAPAPSRTFDATVQRVEPRGSGIAVWLDRTGFYPTSGGQPHDLGTLNGIPVVDVLDDEHGGIVHVLTTAGVSAGEAVQGVIDWERRLDHMQQHTGQHVLSAVFERLFGARTVSFHLGTDSSTIDLDRELTSSQLSEGELDANRVVWDDRMVSVRYATAAEARQLPLRKETAREGTLRLVDVDGVDLSACGGTHVARTGTIGQIALVAFERFKGGQRVEFVCGRRALRRHRLLRETSAAAVRLLSVLPSELPAAIERMQAESKQQKRALAVIQQGLARYESDALAAAAEPLASGGRVVMRIIDGDAVRLKMLATAVAEHDGVAALFVSQTTPVLAVAARASGVTFSCQDVIAALLAKFGGRGGGKPDLAQCGGLDASPEAILEYARAAIQG